MTVHSSVLLLFLAFLSGSCREVDRHLLVDAYWQLKAIQTDSELIQDGGAMDQINDCEKDDAWKFAYNGILKTYRGNLPCHPDEHFTDIIGGWTLSDGGTQLHIRESGGFSTSYRILHLSAEKLTLQFRSDEAKILLTYKAIPAKLLARAY